MKAPFRTVEADWFDADWTESSSGYEKTVDIDVFGDREQFAQNMERLYSIIAVDGVEPTEENIASGEYALGLDTLALVSSSAAADSGERALWLWLQGGVGQAFISSQGYMEAVR